MNRWSVRTKLAVGFGVMVLLVAVGAVTSIWSTRAIAGELTDVFDRDLRPLASLTDLTRALELSRVALREHLLAETASDKQRLEAEMASSDRIVMDRLAEARAVWVRESKGGVADAFERRWKDYQEERDAIMRASRAGERQEGTSMLRGPAYVRVAEALDRLVAEDLRVADKRRASALDTSRQTLWIVSLGSIAAVLCSIAGVNWLTRSIAGRLRKLSGVAEAIADGHLDRSADAEGTDEIAALGRSFNTMTGRLRALLEAERVTRAGLERSLEVVRESVAGLAAAATEILATTAQQASGATQTASAVSETSVTVDEVKQTSELAAQKALQVADSARKSEQVSQTGRQVVEQLIGAMRRIQSQADSIAQSILRLSEQSQMIGEIIASVNDLAEQSNLLSVNAAIEAAKAGEHGRGFGVVAAEIKSLAEQSKQATQQVRAILNDIQKATHAAVLATEQGSKAVDSGMSLTDHAADAIQQLTATIAESVAAATQIAASSQQQAVGTDQIALAMVQIREATQQNVAGARQAERAAHDLNELGGRLKGLLQDHPGARAAAPVSAPMLAATD